METLKKPQKTNKADQKLFDTLNTLLKEQGIITHKGSIVDATFVTVPVRHTTKKDNEHLKNGATTVDLDAKDEKRITKGEIKNKDNVTAQTDIDTR
jgi:hypothetical protein